MLSVLLYNLDVRRLALVRCRLLRERQGAPAMVRFEKALMLAKGVKEALYERRSVRGLAAAARLQVMVIAVPMSNVHWRSIHWRSIMEVAGTCKPPWKVAATTEQDLVPWYCLVLLFCAPCCLYIDKQPCYCYPWEVY